MKGAISVTVFLRHLPPIYPAFHIHELTIYKYAAKGKIPATRVGNVWRFNKEVIDRWLRQGRKK